MFQLPPLPPSAPYWMHFIPFGIEILRLFISRAPAEEKKTVVIRSQEAARNARKKGRIKSKLVDKEMR